VSLVALDVVLYSIHTTLCACGHEDDGNNDPRTPHIYEGSAMGRFCRRLGQRRPADLKLVRLSQWTSSQNAWRGNLRFVNSEVEWFGSHDEAIKTVEAVCGPCENDNVAIQKIFDPTSWMKTQ
jgi:hypothetical protein